MALVETNGLRFFNYSNCNYLQDFLDMITDELEEVIDAYNTIAQEKKY